MQGMLISLALIAASFVDLTLGREYHYERPVVPFESGVTRPPHRMTVRTFEPNAQTYDVTVHDSEKIYEGSEVRMAHSYPSGSSSPVTGYAGNRGGEVVATTGAHQTVYTNPLVAEQYQTLQQQGATYVAPATQQAPLTHATASSQSQQLGYATSVSHQQYSNQQQQYQQQPQLKQQGQQQYQQVQQQQQVHQKQNQQQYQQQQAHVQQQYQQVQQQQQQVQQQYQQAQQQQHQQVQQQYQQIQQQNQQEQHLQQHQYQQHQQQQLYQQHQQQYQEQYQQQQQSHHQHFQQQQLQHQQQQQNHQQQQNYQQQQQYQQQSTGQQQIGQQQQNQIPITTPGQYGNYIAQSDAGQLDVYAQKQATPGATRPYTRQITTCTPDGKCDTSNLLPGQADARHQHFVVSAPTIRQPVSDKCKKLSNNGGSLAGSAQSASAGSYSAALQRPPNRRLAEYTEVVVPTIAYN